jgi:hypothetical protein
MSTTDRLLADLHIVICDTVTAIEPKLDRDSIEQTVTKVANTRAKLRRLAGALADEPDLLTSGRPAGPRLIELLIRALLNVGATHVQLPRCARCDRPLPLTRLNDRGARICTTCAAEERLATRHVCIGCGKRKRMVGHGRDGKPLCEKCTRRDRVGNYLPTLIDQLDALETGLDRLRLHATVIRALPKNFQQRDVSWEIEAHPDLLRTNPALGSHRLVVLAQELISQGARGIAVPVCALCGSLSAIRWGKDGVRCCRHCYESSKQQPCSNCGQLRAVISRTTTGLPLCSGCNLNDPLNHEECTGCGRRAFIIRRDPSRRLCRRCWRAPDATCSNCGETRPCYFADTDMPICEKCSNRLRPHEECSHCGFKREVAARTHGGKPLCSTCNAAYEPCKQCGKTKKVITRTADGPLCSTCYRKDPISFRTCSRCGKFERLYRRGLCTACAAVEQLRAMFASNDGTVPHRAEPIIAALTTSDPASLLNWINKAEAAQILQQLIANDRPITHDALDKYRTNRTIPILRAALVAADILPSRDEHLATLEHWISATTTAIADPAHRRLIRSWATWTHVRRLRQQSKKQAITYNQIGTVRYEILLAKRLLEHLAAHGLTLRTCTQADIDDFLASGPRRHADIRRFVQWAAKNGEASALDIAYPAQVRPRESIEDDHRWGLVNRLLHDEDLDPGNRLAGLLVLLYGQRASRITRLTTTDLNLSGNKTTLSLGNQPLELPQPIDQLAKQLAEHRRHRILLTRPDDTPWLFPGGLPGSHLSDARLGARLKKLGIRLRQGRNAALIHLAAELPSTVLANLLGIHAYTATVWAEIGAMSKASYAAKLMSQPDDTDHVAPRHQPDGTVR